MVYQGRRTKLKLRSSLRSDRRGDGISSTLTVVPFGSQSSLRDEHRLLLRLVGGLTTTGVVIQRVETRSTHQHHFLVVVKGGRPGRRTLYEDVVILKTRETKTRGGCTKGCVGTGVLTLKGTPTLRKIVHVYEVEGRLKKKKNCSSWKDTDEVGVGERLLPGRRVH